MGPVKYRKVHGVGLRHLEARLIKSARHAWRFGKKSSIFADEKSSIFATKKSSIFADEIERLSLDVAQQDSVVLQRSQVHFWRRARVRPPSRQISDRWPRAITAYI